MKKTSSRSADQLRPEYDFRAMKGAVRGKYARAMRAGANIALLEPEVAKAFPTDEAVNEALRTVLRVLKPLGRARRGVEQRGVPDKAR